MKNRMNKSFFYITLFLTIVFSSCSNSNDELPLELTIQDKVALLEGGEWLVKGYEDKVMYTFNDGKQFTYYGIDSVFTENPIPGAFEYTITGNTITIDYNFGNISSYEILFSCDNNIVEFYKEGELNNTLYKKGSNYEQCL